MRIPNPTAHPVILSAVLAVVVATTGFAIASSDLGIPNSLGNRSVVAVPQPGGLESNEQLTRNTRSGPSKPSLGDAVPVAASLRSLQALEGARIAASGPTIDPSPSLPPGSPADPAPAPVEEPPPLPVADPEPAPVPDPDPPPVTTPSPTPPQKSGVDPAVPATPAPAPEPNTDPTLASADLAVGIDGHYAGWPSAEVADRTALGAPVTRHMWELDNPVNAEEPLMVMAATRVQTRIQALLGGNDLGDPAHLRDFTVAFVRYWGPGGAFWDNHPELDEARYAITSIELGNEPYFGAMTATDYADTVRPTLEAVAALGVPVKVILPSYIYGTRTTWIDTLYARIPNLNSLFYAFADHPYWYGHDPADQGNDGPFERLDSLRERMDAHGAGAKPIYITEYGESTASCGSECVTEATQAAHLKAMLDAVVSRQDWDVEMLEFFQLRDRGTNSSDREEQFGLLREDGSPKPSYSILREAMQRYRG